MSKVSETICVGISIGDINGIGAEVILKALEDNRILSTCTPIIYGSTKVLSYHKKTLDLPEINFNSIPSADKAIAKKINVINCWNEEVNIDLGNSTSDGGKYALKSLQCCVEDMASNKIDVMITAPINKTNIQSKEFNFPGHTEFLAKYSNTEDYLMILVADSFRIGVVTSHIPLKEVATSLTKEAIVKKAKVFENSLIRDFGITKPRIAILGLNPHAGDNGLLGKEESEIIKPAIKELSEQGIKAFGPYAADGFFGSGSFGSFDGILAMYHDQGLTPFKALTFDNGVNYTAGLPIVRTSPDHGTAYEIAGKNQASESSFRNAIYLACDIFNQRKISREIFANPLVVSTDYKKDS
jgi:4-hydroxythreonine-4-phosphate dehydrogenase